MLEINQLTEWGRARVLVVDDDASTRHLLADLLGSRNDVEFFDCVESAEIALEKWDKEKFDVLLVDINLPRMSGIQMVDCLSKRSQQMPAVVFVTAHHQHAVAAFERHAVDYVLKPFSTQRMHEALNKAIRRISNERAASLMEIIPRLRSLAVAAKPSKIAIKIEGRIIFINPAEVISAEAQGNYVLLVKASGTYLVRSSISTVGEQLRPYGFIRIHRSVLMNSAWVQEIQPHATGAYVLRTKGGKEYAVSRTYKENLRELAGFWLGSEALFSNKPSEILDRDAH